MKTQSSKYYNQSSKSEQYGVVDAKGREIGACVFAFEVDYTEIPEDSLGWSSTPPGHYYGFIPQAQRGGENFGASQCAKLFTTEKERDAAAAKYLAGARKRAPVVARCESVKLARKTSGAV